MSFEGYTQIFTVDGEYLELDVYDPRERGLFNEGKVKYFHTVDETNGTTEEDGCIPARLITVKEEIFDVVSRETKQVMYSIVRKTYAPDLTDSLWNEVVWPNEI